MFRKFGEHRTSYSQTKFTISLCVFIKLMSSTPSLASIILNNAVYSGGVQQEDINSNGGQLVVNSYSAGTVSENTAGIFGATTTSFYSMLPSPSPSVKTAIVDNTITNTTYKLGDAGGMATASLNYNFEIIGSSGLVPVNVHEMTSAQTSGEGYTKASFSVNNGNNQDLFNEITIQNSSISAILNAADLDPKTIQGDTYEIGEGGTFNFEANTVYSVSLLSYTSIHLSDDVFDQNYAGSSVDPTFQLLPAQENNYSIIFSPNIGNVSSAVPEPTTWALMLMGFGLLGCAMRDRRNDNPLFAYDRPAGQRSQ